MLDRIIQGEATESRYEAWQDYRACLTNFIIDSVEHYYQKALLRAEHAIRSKSRYERGELLLRKADGMHKPSLAIWGAGGCNDIDIGTLQRYFYLVLIDRDTDKLAAVKEKYNLTDCACIDIRFFDVAYDEYEIIVDMFEDGCESAQVKEYITEIIDKMELPPYTDLPRFDFSVAAGLCSQLCSRLMAIADIYGRTDEFEEFIKSVNKKAVDRLLDAMNILTEKLTVFAYETEVYDSRERAKAIQEQEQLAEESDNEELLLADNKIAGNDILVEYLRLHIYRRNSLRVLHRGAGLWDFSQEKLYLMAYLGVEKL